MSKNTKKKAGSSNKIDMNVVDEKLQEMVQNEKLDEMLKDEPSAAVEEAEVLETEEEEDITVETEETEEEAEVTDVIEEVTKDVDEKKIKKIAWWVSIPKKEQLKTADIVYVTHLRHFGIFVEPAKKDGLVKVRLYKVGSKTDVYTRDWYFDFDNVLLVKRGNHVRRGFAETETAFIKRERKSKEKVVEVAEAE